MSYSLQLHGLQHTRPPCPSQTPGVYTNSCPLSRWCHPKISSSVILFSSHLQFFPASGSFLTSQFFTSGGQSIGASTSASVLNNEYSGLISFSMDSFDLPAVQGTLKSLLQHHSSKASILHHLACFMVQLSHPWEFSMTTGKTIALTMWIFVGIVTDIGRSKKNKSYNVKNKKIAVYVSRWHPVSPFLRMGELCWGQHMSHSRDHLLDWMTCQTM